MMNKCSKIRLRVSVLRTNGTLVIFCSTMLCKVYSQYDENMDTQKEYQPSLEKTNNFMSYQILYKPACTVTEAV